MAERTHASLQLALVKDAIEFIRWRLSGMPTSREVEELREKARVYAGEVERWGVSSPGTEQREMVLRGLIKLHAKMAKLGRHGMGHGDAEP
jgi:hypothetical protein